MPMVYPSGAALAIAECPTTPEPPVRLTTLNGCPRSFSSSAATIRAVASVPPPAPHGTITVTGRAGYAWAKPALRPRPAVAATAADEAANARRVILGMAFLPGGAGEVWRSCDGSIMQLRRGVASCAGAA